MATVEIELRNYSQEKKKREARTGKAEKPRKGAGLCPLVLRITAGAQVTRKNTGLYIRPEEWDAQKRRVNRKHPEWSRLNDALDALTKEAEAVKADLITARQPIRGSAVIARLFTTQDFYEAAATARKTYRPEQIGTRKNFDTMVSRIRGFAPSLLLEEITPGFLAAFKTHLQTKGKGTDANGAPVGLAFNSVLTTLGRLKTLLASLELKGGNPFDKVAVGTFRASAVDGLDMAEIQRLRYYLPESPMERLALDTFLFSFYAAGMRSGDVLALPWSAVRGSRIVYQEGKKLHHGTGSLSIPVNPVLAEILDRYDRSTATVFNILPTGPKTPATYAEKMEIQRKIVHALRAIAKRCGITKAITFKLARTSFSRIANEASGRNVYGIQQAMGHTNVKTTEIYLGSDTRAVDELLKVVYG